MVVEAEKVPGNAEDDLGWTPLMCASSAGRVDVVRFLLTLPTVDVSHQNANGQNSLHYAASKGHTEVTHRGSFPSYRGLVRLYES